MVSHTVSPLKSLPKPPDFLPHQKIDYKFSDIWKWIGPKMFYNKILGYKGNFLKNLENNVSSALVLHDQINKVKEYVSSNSFNLMHPKALWQFFKTKSMNETIQIIDPGSSEVIEYFTFPRQKRGDYLSLADYLNPTGDTIAFFACTSGNKVSELADLWIEEGKYKDAFILQSLALATAEALAELVHFELRSLWGFVDSKNLSFSEIMSAKYRGCRYSFGYPACPNLEDQEKLWKLLKPDQIGIDLTEGYMMDPEASVSALVLHHPEAKYFSI